MPDDVTQGAPGAPAAGAGAAGGSGSLSAEEIQNLLKDPGAGSGTDTSHEDPFKDIPWDKVSAAWKAGKAPEALRKEAELPFLQEFTRKSQAFGKEREAFFASVVDRLTERGVAPPDQKEALREKLKESGFPLEAVDAYIDSKLQPAMTDLSSSRMESLAAAAHPYVGTRREDIANIIRTNPSAARLILSNGGRDGHEVIVGIATRLENEDLKAKLKQQEDGLPALRMQIAKEVIAELKKTGQVLPPTTSHAGQGPTAGGTSEKFTDFKGAALAAAKEGNFPL